MAQSSAVLAQVVLEGDPVNRSGVEQAIRTLGDLPVITLLGDMTTSVDAGEATWRQDVLVQDRDHAAHVAEKLLAGVVLRELVNSGANVRGYRLEVARRWERRR